MKARRLTINHRQESGQTMLTDAQLLTQLQAGDDASFEVLFHRHYDRVYGILYRLLGNKSDAEDVAQQVFLKLYHAPRRIRFQGDEVNVAGWLYRVAVNTGYNTLRSQQRRNIWQDRLGWLWPSETQSPDPAIVAEGHDEQAKVRLVLAQMKPRDVKLLLLRHSGLSYKELAVVLNVATGSIGSLLTRAERAFAKKYRLAYPGEVQNK
jgi:RNA polymerase sigma-70 factor (ECF subfamily)